MTKRPAVPPANRSPKGGGSNPASGQKVTRADADRIRRKENLKRQGAPGNLFQNTTNQGHQQDR